MQFKFMLVILTTIFLFACQKEDKYRAFSNNWKGPQTYGKVSAFRDGRLWQASGVAGLSGSSGLYAITFQTFDPIDSVYTEDLSFSNVPFKVGRYDYIHHLVVVANNPIYADSLVSLYSEGYDDLFGPGFYADTTKHNWLLIESIDTIQNVIKGKFDVHYRISEDGATYSNYPLTVHFSGGEFEVKVRK
jgi:hypothetical protein